MVNARTKGKSGEYEALSLFAKVMNETENELDKRGVFKFGPDNRPSLMLKRNLEQVRGGGHDIVGIPLIALEVKRVEKNQINGWWKQAVGQAPQGLQPVLVHRANRQPWRVRTWAAIHVGGVSGWVAVDYALDDFLIIYRSAYAEHLTREIASGRLAP